MEVAFGNGASLFDGGGWFRDAGILVTVPPDLRVSNFPGESKMASVQKTTDSSSLAEVVDRILDKGVVIDIWAKVSLVGIELLSVEARIVIASVETYLKYAEAIGLTATAAAPA